jgi:hypothetical protein
VTRAADAQRRQAEAKEAEREKDFVYTDKEWDIDAFYDQHVKPKTQAAAAAAAAAPDDNAQAEADDGEDDAAAAAGGGKKEKKGKKKQGVLEEEEPDLNAIMDELDGI